MLILLYGLDTYRSNQKLKEIIVSYQVKHKSGLNFRQFDWSADCRPELKNILESVSMFDEKRLIIIKKACLVAKNEQQELIELLEREKLEKDKETIIVFFEEEKIEESQLSHWLIKKSKMIEVFDYLTGAKLNQWVKKEVQNLGGSILDEAVIKITSLVGTDLWQMQNELGKLVNYKNGKPIASADIDLLVSSHFDPNIFATIDALAARNKNLAYKLVHQHLNRGENEIYILTMFIYQFRNLLQIKSLTEEGWPSNALAKKTGLHPFVIKKSWPQLRNFSLEALKKIYERLLKLDIAIKRGKIEPSVALDLVVGEIAR